MKLVLSAVSLVAGVALVTVGLWLAWRPLAYVFVGLCLMAAGLFTEGVE